MVRPVQFFLEEFRRGKKGKELSLLTKHFPDPRQFVTTRQVANAIHDTTSKKASKPKGVSTPKPP